MNLLLFLSLICLLFFHPIMMLMALILFTLFLAVMFYNSFQFSFVSLMMVLLILGGMLIIFMYMISLCPNSKMNFNIKTFLILPLLFFSFSKNNSFWKFELPMINKIYMMHYVTMMILMMFFLIMTLMIVSKNLKWINAPIKKFT
nr:NADH dehydrogenase subunit 6 [Hyalomma asiaticum]